MGPTRTILGFEVTPTHINAALCSHGVIAAATSFPLPDNLVSGGRVVSFEALSQKLRACVKTAGLPGTRAALALGGRDVFSRRVTLPAMTVDELAINLPFEFKDFLGDEPSKFTFDYAALGTSYDEEGRPAELDLLAAAAPAAVIDEYRWAFKGAGLKLVLAAPDIMAFANIIGPAREDFCFLELGMHDSVVHMFPRGRYEVSRSVDVGVGSVVEAVAAHFSVDPSLALSYLEADFEGASGLAACRELYETLAIEVARSVSFYGFNFPESDLKTLHLCGTGTFIAPLVEVLRQTLPVDIASVRALIPHEGVEARVLEQCAVAAGLALQGEGASR